MDLAFYAQSFSISYFAGLIVGALQGVSKDVLLSDHYSPCSDYWKEHPLVPEVDAIAAGSFKRLNPPDIKASGYVVRSLESVLWAFHHTDNFKDGCLKVGVLAVLHAVTKLS